MPHRNRKTNQNDKPKCETVSGVVEIVEMTEPRKYLSESGWSPFVFEDKIRWIDPQKPYDVSKNEREALMIQSSRDKTKTCGRYSFTYHEMENDNGDSE